MNKKSTAIIMLIVCIMVWGLIFSGCQSHKFIAVAQVEFTTNGELVKKISKRYGMYTYSHSVTADDYWSVPYEQHISDQSFQGTNLKVTYQIPKEERGKTRYEVKADETKIVYYQSYSFGSPIYSAYKYTGVAYLIVYVKIINNSTIVVRDNKGETTYTVSSYKITEFRS